MKFNLSLAEFTKIYTFFQLVVLTVALLNNQLQLYIK